MTDRTQWGILPACIRRWSSFLPVKERHGLQQIDGYRGGYILRQEGTDEVEFVVMNLFESLEAVRAFAGPEYTVPVFEPEARQLLSKVEPVARHYEVKTTP